MGTKFFDELEIRPPGEREADLVARLPAQIAMAKKEASGWSKHLAGIDPAQITSREALAKLPVLRKADLMAAQSEEPPLGGFAAGDFSTYKRIFMSPGPIWEPQGPEADPWKSARSFHAVGIRPGDIVHNALSYHMTPGGFILDQGARAYGCVVFPAGIGNTDLQVSAISSLRPRAYAGTPDYLKVILDRADELGADVSSITRGLVSGGALYPSLREEYAKRGVKVLQSYATADLGIVAYESEAMEGLIANEDFIIEIVRPGTGEPVAEGEVGELVVTSFSPTYPLIRFATGDLSAVLPGTSPCGRTNMRLKGWMGRADQRTKVKGMFVDPAQIDRLRKQAGDDVRRARLSVVRKGEQDHMILKVETEAASDDFIAALKTYLKEHTGLSGEVELVAPDSLPNDGKVISDERELSV
ncbi:Phenylacetate-coenzyme A ligase [Pseudovibrio axinellae]|uniref:Phenylacetate-coenzyme A ligase n=1 Tax=Pseudovibrio axinellae TaxID=989403 RepID=A0A166A927_9HYPH|nr:AMP-binding protein [Pseudovibrio axinellae]KZL20742.1 Phenylacetate-coenzyme A ligase [Pseudovibrio axinellae]SER24062.1 phenylacetate-CoA ligase [Pseudovibrio axinellae]